MSSNEAKSVEEGSSENKLPSRTHTEQENMELESDSDLMKGGRSPSSKRDNGFPPAQTSPVNYDQLKEEMEVAEALLKVANTCPNNIGNADPPVMNSLQQHQTETSSASSATNSAPQNQPTSLVLSLLDMRERVPSPEHEERVKFLPENQENFSVNDNQPETNSPRPQRMNSPVVRVNSPVNDYQSETKSPWPQRMNMPVIEVNSPANDHQFETNSPWHQQTNTPVIQVNSHANDHQSETNSPRHQRTNTPVIQVNSHANDHQFETNSPRHQQTNTPVIQVNSHANDHQSETNSPRHQQTNTPVIQVNSHANDHQSKTNSPRHQLPSTHVIQVNSHTNDHQSEMISPRPQRMNMPVFQVNSHMNDHQSEMNSPCPQWMNTPVIQVNSHVNDHQSKMNSPWPQWVNRPVIQVNSHVNDHQSEMNSPWPRWMNSPVTQVNSHMNDNQSQTNSLRPQWMNSSTIQLNTPVNDHQHETNFCRLQKMKAPVDQVNDVPNMYAGAHGGEYNPPISNLPPEYWSDKYGTTQFPCLSAQKTTKLGTSVEGTYAQGDWFPLNQSSMEHKFVQGESLIPYRPLQYPIQQDLNEGPIAGNVFEPPLGNQPTGNHHAYRIYLPEAPMDSCPREIQFPGFFSQAMGSNDTHPTDQVSSHRTLSNVPIQQGTVGNNLEPMLPNRSRGPPLDYLRQGMMLPETRLTLGNGQGESSTNRAKRKAIWQDGIPDMHSGSRSAIQ